MSDITQGAAIAIAGARKVYTVFPQAQRVAVDDVTLEVPEGAIHGLLGPNGAGKTTTLKMLLGLVRPTAGTFPVLGVDSRSRAGRAQLGFLPEQPYFPPQLTAAQAMRLYARLSGVPEREIAARTGELLDARRARGPRVHHALGVLARHAPAARHRAGDRLASDGRGARRAGQRPRPAGPARRAQPDAAAARRGRDGAALQPPALRGRDGLRPRVDHEPRPRRRRRPDPRAAQRRGAHDDPRRGPARTACRRR